MVSFRWCIWQFCYVTGTAVAFGMSTACDTYFSQYHGSVNRHKLGVMLQKGKSLDWLMLCLCGKWPQTRQTRQFLKVRTHERDVTMFAEFSGNLAIDSAPCRKTLRIGQISIINNTGGIFGQICIKSSVIKIKFSGFQLLSFLKKERCSSFLSRSITYQFFSVEYSPL